jgi:hypothetical protein
MKNCIRELVMQLAHTIVDKYYRYYRLLSYNVRIVRSDGRIQYSAWDLLI